MLAAHLKCPYCGEKSSISTSRWHLIITLAAIFWKKDRSSVIRLYLVTLVQAGCFNHFLETVCVCVGRCCFFKQCSSNMLCWPVISPQRLESLWSFTSVTSAQRGLLPLLIVSEAVLRFISHGTSKESMTLWLFGCLDGKRYCILDDNC